MDQSLSQTEKSLLYQLNSKVEKILLMLTTSQPRNSDIPVDYLALPEAAAYICKSKSTLYQYVHKGLIPNSKRGRLLIFIRTDLEEWIAQGRRKTNDEILSDEENLMIDLRKKKLK